MTPIELHFTPSIFIRRWLCILYVLAGITAFFLTWLICLLAWLGMAGYFFWQWRHPAREGYLQAGSDGRVILNINGYQQQAEILPSSVITAWVMVLHLRLDEGETSLVLGPDSAEGDALCQWRTWLRWTLPALQRRVNLSINEQEQGG